MNQMVILLNGPSSSGRSTLVVLLSIASLVALIIAGFRSAHAAKGK